MINADQSETDKFASMAAQWWDLDGPCKPLHELNPLRLGFIQEYGTLKDKVIADIGCGGGILSESMAIKGGIVTGIDADKQVIKTAKLHALDAEVNITYCVADVAEYATNNTESCDIVTCMEMLEHVPDPAAIIESCVKLTKPGGILFFSTLIRNVKSYFQSIIGAEYILNMLPRGTHDYDRFIKPHEINRVAESLNLTLIDLKGVTYNPLLRQFSLSNNVDVNYMCAYRKAAIPHD